MTRFRKWQIAILVCVCLYTLVGFFGIPALATYWIKKNLSEQTQRQVTLEKMRFNPYSLKLRVEYLFIEAKIGERPWLGFDALEVDLAWKSIFKWGLVVESVTLKNPIGFIRREKDGRFNFSDLLERASSNPQTAETNEETDSALPKLAVDSFSIINGKIEFEDLSTASPFKTQFTPINLSLEKFSTFENSDNRLTLQADNSLGSTFSWSGDLEPRAMQSEGEINLTRLKIESFSPYFLNYLNFEIEDTYVDLQFAYRVNLSDPANPFSIHGGQVKFSDLKIKPEGVDEYHFELPQLVVSELAVDILPQRMSIGSIDVEGGALLLRQSQEGEINLLKLAELKLNEEASSSAEGAGEGNQSAWEYVMGTVSLREFEIRAEDLKPQTPARFVAKVEEASLDGFSSDLSERHAFDLAMTLAETGALKTKGTFQLEPLLLNTQLELSDYPLTSLQPYVATYAALSVEGGVFQLNGDFSFEAQEGESPNISFNGDLSVDSFATVETVAQQELFDMKQIALQGIAFQSVPLQASIEKVILVEPAITVVRMPDNQFNFASLIHSPETEEVPLAEKSSEQALVVDALIKRLELTDASMHFIDQSLSPEVSLQSEQVSGVVENISSSGKDKATVDISGVLNNKAQLNLKAQLYPSAFEKETQLNLELNGFNLGPVSSYSGKYVGKTIAGGTLSLNVDCTIGDSALDGKNTVIIDGFNFGENVESEDATTLPVGLAVSLLKDVNGRIHLNLPVKGRVDDPKFNYFSIAFTVVGNLLAKAATAPFALLGSLVPDGDAASLSYVNFEPGASELNEEGKAKLKTLVDVLSQRPNLRLELQGAYDLESDQVVLAEQQLNASLIALHQEGIREKDLPDLEDEMIRSALIESAYKQLPEANKIDPKTLEPDTPLTTEKMNEALLEAVVVEKSALVSLALQRAFSVRTFLVQDSQLAAQRLMVVDTVAEEHKAAQVKFTLK